MSYRINLKLITNFVNFQVPTIEYHNMTWTWLDLLLAVKSRIKDSLLSQAIKQKLSLKHRVGPGVGMVSSTSGEKSSSNSDSHSTNTSTNDDEEKAKLLLGARDIVAKMSSKK